MPEFDSAESPSEFPSATGLGSFGFQARLVWDRRILAGNRSFQCRRSPISGPSEFPSATGLGSFGVQSRLVWDRGSCSDRPQRPSRFKASGFLRLTCGGVKHEVLIKRVTLCYAIVFPGWKSVFRAGFRPDFNRERGKNGPARPRRGSRRPRV